MLYWVLLRQNQSCSSCSGDIIYVSIHFDYSSCMLDEEVTGQ